MPSPSRPKKPAPKPRRAPAKKEPAPKKRAAPKGGKATKPAVKASPAKVERVAPTAGADTGLAFPIEIDPKQIEATLKKVGDELGHWAKKGRYTKVRFKFRGKQLLPDLPLAAVVAAEGLTFYWGGIIRALLFNLGTGAVFGVELVNDSEKKIAAGKERLLRGDLDEALALFREAADMDRDNPNVHLNLGIALKLRGEKVGARQSLEKARRLDPEGPIGQEAEKILSTLPSQMTVTSVVQNGAPLNPDRPSGAV